MDISDEHLIEIRDNEGPKYNKTHIYFGEGKGATTAAVGLIARASGYDLDIKCVQFMKNDETGLGNFLQNLSNVDYSCFEFDEFVNSEKGMSEEQIEKTKEGLEEIRKTDTDYDMLVCDEILNLPIFTMNNEDFEVSYKDIEEVIRELDGSMELVLTGRYSTQNLNQMSDYVSQIVNIEHPYPELDARPGIEY